MKSILTLSFLTLLLVTTRPCLAEWLIEPIAKEDAKGMGVEVRIKEAGPDAVRVEMQIDTEGKLKGMIRVDMRVDMGGKSLVASLQEDRSKQGFVTVSFAVDRKQLDKIRLWVMVPESLGGNAYEVRPAHFAPAE